MRSPFSRFFGGGAKQEPEVKNEVEVEEVSMASEEVVKIPIVNIIPNRYQPRTVFDDDKIEELSRTIYLQYKVPELEGRIAVCTGGTSDIPVAEEAARTAEFFGCYVDRIYDVGVAGIHRLLSKTELIRKANCVVAIAGMEGALAGVIAGLVDKPVIAVPTSVGYGANMQGMSALLTMINSCAEGVAVVNIDNGFGAGYLSAQINRLAIDVVKE